MRKLIISIVLLLLLVNCEAKNNIMKIQSEFKGSNNQAFIDAIVTGDIGYVENYLNNNGSVNFTSGNGTSPLYLAILLKNKKIFDLLIDNNADFNLKRSGKNGLSPFLLAVNIEDESYYLKTLLQKGADPNITNNDNPTMPKPIFYAIEGFNIENLELLAEHGAILDVQNQYEESPMIYAGNINQFDMVYKLLELGADYTLKDKWGKSIIYNLKHNNVDPNSDKGMYKDKCLEFLRSKGVKFK